jgi:hypothetical protein
MKNIYLLLILLVITSGSLIYSKAIELFLINQNFSWTFSKIIPYFLLVLEGILLGLIAKRMLKSKKIIKLGVQFICIIFPFLTGFALNPIYQGDFSKNGSTNVVNAKNDKFKGYDLVVITITGCPFCHESTFYANKMLQRNPKLKIKYLVCNNNEAETKPYREKLDKKIAVELAQTPQQMAQTAGGSFPAFILIKENKAIQKWSNDQFGVRAKDLVESATN